MSKTKPKISSNIFRLHQSRTQDRWVYLRVDKKIKSKDLLDYFDWDETSKVFSYMNESWDMDFDDDAGGEYKITKLPHFTHKILYDRYGKLLPYWKIEFCDISINEDGTWKKEYERLLSKSK